MLGQIHSNTHYIPPIQPTWVTEYAASYTAPPMSAYTHGNPVTSSNGSLKRSNIIPQQVKVLVHLLTSLLTYSDVITNN